MEIAEVAQILGLCHFLKAPKHVFITDETVSSKGNGVTFYRGLQPKNRGDAIFLSRHADETTPIHEAIHAELGLDEFGTEILTRLILRKNKLMQNLPTLKSLFQKELSYRKVDASEEFPQAHSIFRGRVEHYIRE